MLEPVRLAQLSPPPGAGADFVVAAWGSFAGNLACPARTGEGRRLVRRLQQAGACCPLPTLATETGTGRLSCGSCGSWWSASHSSDCLVAARCSLPVGIDVQRHVRRPAAMRWLARVTQVQFEPSIRHWAIAEAYWKASGNANRRPEAGEFNLPRLAASGWGRYAFDGTNEMVYWLHESEGLSLAVVLGPVAETPANEADRRSTRENAPFIRHVSSVGPVLRSGSSAAQQQLPAC